MCVYVCMYVCIKWRDDILLTRNINHYVLIYLFIYLLICLLVCLFVHNLQSCYVGPKIAPVLVFSNNYPYCEHRQDFWAQRGLIGIWKYVVKVCLIIQNCSKLRNYCNRNSFLTAGSLIILLFIDSLVDELNQYLLLMTGNCKLLVLAVMTS